MDEHGSLTTTQLSSGQARLLFQGLQPSGPLSPIRLSDDIKPLPEDTPLLAKAGLLDADGRPSALWAVAARLLANPEIHVACMASVQGQTEVIHAYGSLSGDFVGYTPRGVAEHVLTFPLTREHLFAFLSSRLGLTRPTLDINASVTLHAAGVLALAGYADSDLAARLEALLAREPYDAVGFLPQQILVSVREGTLSDDSRWLVPAVRSMLPSLPDITPAIIHSGLEELTEAGWLETGSDGKVFATGPFASAALHLQSLIGSGSFTVFGVRDGKTGVMLHLGVLRTLANAWALEFGEEAGESVVQVMAVSGERLLRALDAAFVEDSATESSSRKKVAAQFCSQCRASVNENDKFCSSCGAKV